MHDMIGQGTRKVDVDLKELDFLDSQGIGLLVVTHKHLVSLGGTLRILQPKPFVRKVFRTAGVDRFLEIVP